MPEAQELSGRGVRAEVDGQVVLAGNHKLMEENGVTCEDCEKVGTIVHLAVDGSYAGHIVIADQPKEDAKEAIAALKENGLVFWLDRDPGETYYGLDVSGRPLAQGGREDFLARYALRAPIYHRWADFILVKPESPEYAYSRIFTIYTEVCQS